MKSRKEVDGIVSWFMKNMPDPGSELQYADPYGLLVAVILSAQCTDKRVNMTTPALLERFPTPQAMAAATAEEVFPYIKSISYPNNKARHLTGMARGLMDKFGGRVPSDPEDLQKLPGVGRKTAHVIASVVFHKEVIAVDTHVFRISRRLGLSKGKTPLAVENDLNRHFPPELRGRAHHWLILHGRYICTARKPKCDACGLSRWCDTFKTRDVS
ncbi:MAG: endonuclease III [Bacteroidales bacterium]|jgi:endonuclease-3|nr:endonuclease III [Bacteroidales bacterium]MDD3100258.1 endonuclease III [Bacteroidales bacterium]MDD3639070.1 endonuclease III [Bacteroidales bacterium]MDD4480482.1 endonuclease III [Bacteroidales bacterium]MDD5315270.1 endonuclease III [Bacteroidales bacterium]